MCVVCVLCVFVCVCVVCVCWYVCWVVCVREAAGGGGGGREEARDTESKTRTPHKDVGNKYMVYSRLLMAKKWDIVGLLGFLMGIYPLVI